MSKIKYDFFMQRRKYPKFDFGALFLYAFFIVALVVICIFFSYKIRNTYRARIAVATTYPHPTWPEPEVTSDTSVENSDKIQ